MFSSSDYPKEYGRHGRHGHGPGGRGERGRSGGPRGEFGGFFGGFGPGGPGGPRGRGRGRKARRGDIRTAALLLLAEEPRNGYPIMQEIEERCERRLAPEPGLGLPGARAARGRGPDPLGGGRRAQALRDHRRGPRAARQAPGGRAGAMGYAGGRRLARRAGAVRPDAPGRHRRRAARADGHREPIAEAKQGAVARRDARSTGSSPTARERRRTDA